MKEDSKLIKWLSSAEALMSAPTLPEEVEWKQQTNPKKESKDGKYWAVFVPYVDARALQKRLTEAYGSLWSKRTEFLGNKVYKTTIFIGPEDAPFVHRDGFADATDIESTKGGESNSFKRAGVMFGFGTDLYHYPVVYIEVSKPNDKGKTFPVAYSNELAKALRKVTEHILGGLLHSDDTVKISDKKAEIGRVSFGSIEPVEDGSITETNHAPVGNGFPLEVIKKGLFQQTGNMSENLYENALKNWQENSGEYFHNDYIYLVNTNDGSKIWFKLNGEQKKIFVVK